MASTRNVVFVFNIIMTFFRLSFINKLGFYYLSVIKLDNATTENTETNKTAVAVDEPAVIKGKDTKERKKAVIMAEEDDK